MSKNKNMQKKALWFQQLEKKLLRRGTDEHNSLAAVFFNAGVSPISKTGLWPAMLQ